MKMEQMLARISQAEITNAAEWASFCDDVAAVAANELVNNSSLPGELAARQLPDKISSALGQIRHSGVDAILRCDNDMTCLTHPFNYFASIISMLKIHSAPQQLRRSNAPPRSIGTMWNSIWWTKATRH